MGVGGGSNNDYTELLTNKLSKAVSESTIQVTSAESICFGDDLQVHC